MQYEITLGVRQQQADVNGQLKLLGLEYLKKHIKIIFNVITEILKSSYRIDSPVTNIYDYYSSFYRAFAKMQREIDSISNRFLEYLFYACVKFELKCKKTANSSPTYREFTP